MDTKVIEKFYDDTLAASSSRYESVRWEHTSQGKASYKNTLAAVTKYALPHVPAMGSIFELGPGPGTWTKLMLQVAPTAAYDLVDISSEMLAQAKQALPTEAHVTFVHSDILDFQPEKKYDFFFSSRMIEYVPEKGVAIARIASAMQPGARGFIITKTPQYNRPFSKRINSPIHQLQITDTELTRLFEDNGVRVERTVLVTAVFPGLRSGLMDRIATIILSWVPFGWARLCSESYGLVLVKDDR